MPQFICICRAIDSEDGDQIFTLPDGTYTPDPGDLIESEGELFPVVESFIIVLDSPEYRTIDALCKIYPAEAVYSCRWKKAANA